jgi:hypothetical protein
MKYLIIILFISSCAPKHEIDTINPIEINQSKNALRLFGPDGKKILSGNGISPKKWQILRFYTALNGDQSTISEVNVGLMDASTQKNLLSAMPNNIKNATISFNISNTGLNGYGGISEGKFDVILPNGDKLMNSTGDFAFSSGLTPFYLTSFGGLIKNLKVIPVFYLENKKVQVGIEEYKGEFLQIISPETDNLLSFPASVALLFRPS